MGKWGWWGSLVRTGNPVGIPRVVQAKCCLRMVELLVQATVGVGGLRGLTKTQL